ncbi:TPA: terminase [Salmonella enterica]|nr:terminase [Salmonella enterica]
MNQSDEESLKRDYCAGVMTLEEIGRKYGIAESTVRKKAKAGKWVRKKGAKIAKNAHKKRTQKRTSKNTGETSSGAGCEDDDAPEIDNENCANSAETKRKKRGGNPHPVRQFVERNTAAVKHRGYAKYLEADHLMDDAAEMALIDELVFTRARALSVTATLKRMFTELDKTEDIPARTALYGKILRAETALDRNIARIESLERSLATLDIMAVTPAKIIADTEYRVAAREKVKAETDILTSQKQGVNTPLTEAIDELQSLDKGGRL